MKKLTLIKPLKYCPEKYDCIGICRKFITITTDLKFRLNGFYHSFISFTYIRAAEGLLHKSRGLSLFHAPFGFFMPLTEVFTSYFLTLNNDK